LRQRKEKIYLRLTRLIPRGWLYWIAVRIGGIVTTGKYGNTNVPELTFMEALERLGKAK
jgi:hypothetical protein